MGGGISYAYNGDGLRMSKTVGTTSAAFAWDESGNLPLLLQDCGNYQIYGENGQPVEQISGSTPTYVLADQQGSTRILTDGGGSTAATYSYDAWGNVTSHSGPRTTDLQYDGEYTDAETGYRYLRARYYDPSTGQFVSTDPLSKVTHAPYTYAGDTPANAIDPSGLALSVPGVSQDVICSGAGLDPTGWSAGRIPVWSSNGGWITYTSVHSCTIEVRHRIECFVHGFWRWRGRSHYTCGRSSGGAGLQPD